MPAPVILITGALTGIGRATAQAFARESAKVVISGRRQTEGDALEAGLRSLGAEAAFIAADVRHGSRRAYFITGQIIRVNGGKTAS
jgi:NAD(P)-dependent dehydrogenase (short-subunit alcohol dehydrogenase family)